MLSWRGPGHPNNGGAEQVTIEHIKAWQKAGHSVWWFTSMYPGANATETLDDIHIIRKGSAAFGVQLSAAIWYLFKQHPSFDLVIDQIHGLPFFTPLYVRTKKLAYIHEVAKEVWWMNPWPKPFNLIPGIFGSLFESSIIRFVYRRIPFLTVSESTKKDLMEWGIPQNAITVIHNGTNFSDVPKTPGAKTSVPTITFLGAVSKDKGISDALQAFSLIHKQEPTWKFWIVGKTDKEMKDFLKKEVIRLGIEKNTVYWGFVSNVKKFRLLAKSHVLVNPSVREGWGLVNIESNACGTPVVGYDVAGTRDSVLDGVTGVLVKSSPELLAHEVISLCNDKKRYKKLSSNAKQWAHTFTWKESSTKSLKLIEVL